MDKNILPVLNINFILQIWQLLIKILWSASDKLIWCKQKSRAPFRGTAF